MLTILKTTEAGLTRLEHPTNGCWINVIDPTPEEVEQLNEWGIANELVNYALDLDEMPRVERDVDEGYTLILLRVPYYQGANNDIPYTTIPLGIIVKENMLVTVCKYPNDIIKVLNNGKYRGLKTGKRYRFVLYALLETATRYLAVLREVNRAIDAVEDRLQKSTRNEELLTLLKYQKSLVYFTTALRSNEVMMERLQRMQMFGQYDEDQELLEDVLTENQQAIQTVNITTEILSSMMDAFASIISNNLNVVMKALAALTIVLNVPVIIASFYGMNVDLPFHEQPWAFMLVLSLSIGLASLATFIFYKRDWF
ncbi:MAG: magnesium transporter CorA family protein [Anaerolineales bacterium]